MVVSYSVASLFTMYVFVLPGGSGEEGGEVGGKGTQTIAELASANCTFFYSHLRPVRT